jgi:hypothetical protein
MMAPAEKPTGPMKVQLHCKELRRFKLRYSFYDHEGIAVGNTYHLDEFGDQSGTHEWKITKMMEAE